MTRLVHENMTPNHPTRKIRLTVLAGKGAYFILNQLEEKPFATTPIIVQGAAATRQREICLATGLDSADWFNNAAGAMVGECVFDHPDGFDLQYAFLATEGQGLNNALGMYLSIAASAQARATDISAGSLQQFDDVHAPIAGRRMPLAVSWNASESYGVAGPMRFNQVARVPQTNAMTNLYIGGRPFNNAMSGWVRSLKVYNTFRTVEQLGADMIPSTARAVMSGGQSNKHGFFRSQIGQFNTGEENAIAQMDAYWSASENWLINGAMNGSHAIKQNDANADNASANWWYDPITDTFGPRMAYWEEIARAFGVSRIDAFDWDQGESDSVSSVTDLKASWLAIFNQMRSIVGDQPVIVAPIGRRSDAQTVAYNNIRQAQQELASENSWIHLAPEKFIYPLADTVHLTDEGYGAHATPLMRKVMSVLGESVSGGVDGPEVLSAARSGTNITVTLSHSAGSDFTPSSAIAGFHFRNNNAVVAITSVARVSATQVDITLASAPNGSGEEILYYGYGTLFDEVVTYTNLVRDNSTYALPLRATEVTL